MQPEGTSHTGKLFYFSNSSCALTLKTAALRSSPPLPFCRLSEGKCIFQAKAPVALGSSPEGLPPDLSCLLQSGSSLESSGSTGPPLPVTAPSPLLKGRTDLRFYFPFGQQSSQRIRMQCTKTHKKTAWGYCVIRKLYLHCVICDY